MFGCVNVLFTERGAWRLNTAPSTCTGGCPHRPADVFWVGEDVEELLELAAAQLRPPEVQKLEQSRAPHHIQQEMPRPLTKPSCPGGPGRV